jgi:hypothetical protein
MTEEKATGVFSRLMSSTSPAAPTAAVAPEVLKTASARMRTGRSPKRPRNQGTVVSSNHETTAESDNGIPFVAIRNAVKQLGKEAATYRFTLAEKKALRDIVYTYTNQGIKTSENELTRIAINFLVEDYRVNGEASVLWRILDMLHS